ncbi:hypothetical protein [uncultured Brevundimonas sp.]|uniref:hypothetical protein n=1 Tax=uncultured Brevundimonas sp. TaxID=213418 RepID=UPI002612D520|nr:hypothetical protein [uncultured Brevundimonas sp.]
MSSLSLSTLAVSAACVGALSLSACSQPSAGGEDAKPAAGAGSVAIPASCKDHYMLPAMPEPVALAGKPLTEVTCEAFTIEMVWGEAGSSSSIVIVDSQGPLGDIPDSLKGMTEAARSLPLESVKTAHIMIEGVEALAKSTPAAMAEQGGPDFIPTIKDQGGMRYSIGVEPKPSGGQVGSLLGNVRDRYAVTMEIESDSLIGLAAGEAAYAPMLAAMRINKLP